MYGLLQRKGISLPPVSYTYFAAEYNGSLFRLSWHTDGSHFEATLGCHKQPFLLLVKMSEGRTTREHLTVTPPELEQSRMIYHPVPQKRPLYSLDFCFYYVQSDYIKALKAAEIWVHGKTHVPDVDYKLHRKFMLGGFRFPSSPYLYVAPVSTTNANGIGNIPIIVPDDSAPRKGTLRLTYMFPVPPQVLTPIDITKLTPDHYRDLVAKQYFALKSLNKHIWQTAKELYEIAPAHEKLSNNCCDFKLLERTCQHYCASHGFSPSLQQMNNEIML